MNWLNYIPFILVILSAIGLLFTAYGVIWASRHHRLSAKKLQAELGDSDNAKEPFRAKLKPKWSFILAGIAFLAASFLLGYLVGERTNRNLFSNKKRIVMLLPLDEEKEAAYQDGLRQLEGFIEVIKETPAYTEQFEFVVRDSKLDPQIAEDIVKHEIAQGTKVFICTMSKVCIQISKNFPGLIENIKGEKPILISTVASAPDVRVERNISYRFYVRSQEEAEVLANCAINNNFNKATAIAVNDEYGEGAVKEFKKRWDSSRKNWIEGIYLDKKDDFQLEIKKFKETITHDTVIFIVHYGNGIDKIVKALDALGAKNPLFATSTISVKVWREPIENNLRNFNWFTCIPNYNPKNGSEDVIEDFVKYSLKRTIESILALEKEPTKTFDDFWWVKEIPTNLKTSQDNGDIIVPMKCVSKTEFEVRKQ